MATTEIDPRKIQPTEGRVIIKRDKVPDKIGRFYRPATNDRDQRTFQGEVVTINEREYGDAENIIPGDRVHFSTYVNEEDSNFFKWDGEDYVLIPCEAILAVAA